MPEGFTVVEVAKGVSFWTCDRCACVTLRPTEHRAYHHLRAVRLGDALDDLRDELRAGRP